MADPLLIEDCSDGGPSNARSTFTVRGGKDVATYQLKGNPQPTDLQAIPPLLLGDVALDVNNGTNQGSGGLGALRRKLPVQHPLNQSHYCSAITDSYGLGVPTICQTPSPVIGGGKPQTTFALYPEYDFKLEFNPRMYAVLPDSEISAQTSSWHDHDGAQHDFSYVTEWARFTDFDIKPLENYVTAEVGGAMKFRTTDGGGGTVADLNSIPPKINGAVFTGKPRIYLPDSVIKFTWYQVPYRYILSDNCYLDKYKGQINQYDWYNWIAGELLYLNYNPIKYTPPIQGVVAWPDLSGASVSQAKMCDIEFTFLLTRRVAVAPPTPTNLNFVTSGWNCQPCFTTRKFYYASTAQNTDPDPTKGVPNFYSFPFQILFMDPDAVTSNGGL